MHYITSKVLYFVYYVSKMDQFRRFLLKVISKLNVYLFVLKNGCLVILNQCLRSKDLIYDLLSSKDLIYDLRQ